MIGTSAMKMLKLKMIEELKKTISVKNNILNNFLSGMVDKRLL